MEYSNNWLTIANRALVKTGNQQIESFSGGTDNVNFINTLLPEAVESVAGLFPWRCLTKRKALAPSAERPEFGFVYAYPLPNDFARLNSVDTEYPWVRESGEILTDSKYCNITYVRKPLDPTEITPLLRELVTVRLAWNIVQTTTSNTTLMTALQSEFNTLMVLAEKEETQGEPDITEFEGWRANR